LRSFSVLHLLDNLPLPLDPFRAIELTSLSYFFRVQLSLLIPN